MTEQGVIHFLNEENKVWELITIDSDDRIRVWEDEKGTLNELRADGWKNEGGRSHPQRSIGARPRTESRRVIQFPETARARG